MDCARQSELRNAMNQALAHMQELTRKQLTCLQAGDDAAMAALDKELKMAFSAKERAFGALHANREEHGC